MVSLTSEVEMRDHPTMKGKDAIRSADRLPKVSDISPAAPAPAIAPTLTMAEKTEAWVVVKDSVCVISIKAGDVNPSWNANREKRRRRYIGCK